jgi:predicted Zn-dependent protease
MYKRNAMLKKYLRITVLGFCLAGFLFLIFSCALNPVSGKHELMLLSEADEVKLGRQTDAEVVKEYSVFGDPKLTAYLNDFCQRLGKVSHRPQLSYHFKILDASAANAFAVPGGYVYFSRGILENVLRSFGVPKEKLKEMALLNGKNLDQVIPANTLIKLVEKGS